MMVQVYILLVLLLLLVQSGIPATWDEATWGGTVQTQKVWRSVADIGWNAAIRIRTSTTAQSIKWHATDVYFERGRGL